MSVDAGKEDGRAERGRLDAAILGLYGLADVDALANPNLRSGGQAAEHDDDNGGRGFHCWERGLDEIDIVECCHGRPGAF